MTWALSPGSRVYRHDLHQVRQRYPQRPQALCPLVWFDVHQPFHDVGHEEREGLLDQVARVVRGRKFVRRRQDGAKGPWLMLVGQTFSRSSPAACSSGR